jgi:hypothetical protein
VAPARGRALIVKASRKSQRPPSAVFHAITHVWGREYLDVFLNRCIPNQLAPGNVPALPAGSRYRILTSSVHVDEVQAHPMVQALQRVIAVDIVAVEALDRKPGKARGHELMIACHRQAVADAMQAEAALIFLSADFVFSDGSLASIVRRQRAGYRAIVNTGLRLAKESFLHAIDQSGVPLGAIPARELVRMALPHLHPHTRSLFADARAFSVLPVAVYWGVGDEGLAARCLHLHPLMVDPLSPILPKATIDGRYLSRVCPDASRVHVVTDSDEIQMFELTPAKRGVVPTSGRGASVWRTAAVASTCDELQLGYWRQHVIRIHADDFDERWTAASAASDVFAGRVLRVLPYGRMARRYFVFLERMRQRGDRYKQQWRRRRPRVTAKQILRPVRVTLHRSAKTLRKKTRRVFRQVAAR